MSNDRDEVMKVMIDHDSQTCTCVCRCMHERFAHGIHDGIHFSIIYIYMCVCVHTYGLQAGDVALRHGPTTMKPILGQVSGRDKA
jgi:hypothetical protein